MSVEKLDFLKQNPFASTMFLQMKQGVIITDCEGTILTVNPYFTQITGYTCEEVQGRNPRILKSNQHPPSFYQSLWETLLTTGTWKGEILNRKKSGELYSQWLEIYTIKDETGRPSYFMGTLYPLTVQQQKGASPHPSEALTRLPDRQLFLHLLKQTLKNVPSSSSNVAIMALNLDRFSTINKRMGHLYGDRILNEICQRIQGLSHGIAVLSRTHGQFLYFTPLQRVKQIDNLLTSLFRCFNQIPINGEQSIDLHASIGISLFPDDGELAENLVEKAEHALSEARKMQKPFHFYSQQLELRSRSRLQLEAGLRHALEEEQFILYYQPKWHLKKQCVTGYEALIRWQHPKQGLIPPTSFIPICEENQFILPLGEWVLKQACRQGQSWMERYQTTLPIAVNLSVSQFYRSRFVEMVQDVLKRTQFPPQLLQLEITESMAIRDVERAIRIIRDLKRLGISISMDDFGTGYSSLSHLRDLPIDLLKLDRSFMEKLEYNPRQAAITSSVIKLAKQLQIQVIAEGVEKKRQAQFLQAQGCEQIQGFLISPPIPPLEVERRFFRPSSLPSFLQ